MKKALVILLILAVAGGVFAQGLAFTGLVKAGAALSFTDVANSEATFGLWSAKNGYQYRLDLNGVYTNEAANAGVKFNIRLNDAALSSDYAFAWLKVFDGALTFNAGDVSTGSYGTGGGIDTSFDTGAGVGAMVQIAPIPGLEFGLGAYNAGQGNISAVRYNAGFTFTAENLVTLVGNYRYGGTATSADNDMDAALGIKILALADMGFTALNLDAAFLNLQGKAYRYAGTETSGRSRLAVDADYMTIQIGQQIAWTDDTLAVGGRFLQQFQTGGTGTTVASKFADLSFAGYVSYNLGGIVPRLDVGFNKGTNDIGSGAGGARNGMWDIIAKGDHRRGFSEKGMNFGISPSVQFQIDGTGKTIDIGYIFQKDLTDDGATSVTLYPNMRNTIFVDFGVTF